MFTYCLTPVAAHIFCCYTRVSVRQTINQNSKSEQHVDEILRVERYKVVDFLSYANIQYGKFKPD